MSNLIKYLIVDCISYRVPPLLACLTLGLLLFGCASNSKEPDKVILTLTEEFSSVINTNKPKSIFVFMDGTTNNPNLPTNVYRTYKEILANNDEQTIAIYLYGVGNTDNPIAGQAMAIGMEHRTKQAYAFIIKHYMPGDHIYLFGFSRGALSARSLAGLISYAGIPKISENEHDSEILLRIANKIIELTKDVKDKDYKDAWKKWKPGDNPLLAKLILDEKINKKVGRETQSAEVKFLGVWDTVPGSKFLMNEFFADTDLSCKEKLDWNKSLPIIKVISYKGMAKGERYKTDSYPAIRYIAHAVSNDEKRSMFRPLFLCSNTINSDSVINSSYTSLNETVFPGAHADVGGGYGIENNQLPAISLNWMLSLLADHYRFNSKPHKATEAYAKGLAHLSISDSAGNILSECRDRILPKSISKDPSVKDREDAGLVPLFIFGQVTDNGNDERSCVQCENPKEKIKQANIRCVEQKNIKCSYFIQQNWITK